MEYAVVNVSERLTRVYTLTKDEDKAHIERVKAQQKAASDVFLFRGYAEKYGDDKDYWLTQAEKCERAKYEVVTFDEFLRKQREQVLSWPVYEINEETFNYNLNLMYPEQWGTIGDVEMFCMAEMDFGTYTSQYARKGDKYYSATVDIFDRSTWIHNRLPQ